jgi:fatty-acyl-CoA synthase
MYGVVPALPLTNVGKIFKPALQQRETEGVIRSEADAVRAMILVVEIEQEPLSGQSFRIRAACGRRRAAAGAWRLRLQVRGFVAWQIAGRAADALAERGRRGP